MNDRFKFRAFDTFAEKMIQNHISICEGELYEWCPDGLHIKHDIGDSAIVMQCTGLKDKNGKYIYEGDVVKFEETYECACFTNVKVVLFVIVWSDYGFMAKQIKIIQGNVSYEFPLTLSELFEKDLYTEHQTTINLEVIGNKFENPELLKECENVDSINID